VAITLLHPFLFLLMMATAAASTPVTARLRGNFGQAPATVIVSARVEPHADNRVVCAFITNGEYETSSCRPHVGDEAPLQVVFEPFRGLGQGEYAAIVEVVRIARDGKQTRRMNSLTFRILEPFGG